MYFKILKLCWSKEFVFFYTMLVSTIHSIMHFNSNIHFFAVTQQKCHDNYCI